MSAERLQELLAYAWDTFYHDESQTMKMSKLFAQVIRKEMADNTFRPRQRSVAATGVWEKRWRDSTTLHARSEAIKPL